MFWFVRTKALKVQQQEAKRETEIKREKRETALRKAAQRTSGENERKRIEREAQELQHEMELQKALDDQEDRRKLDLIQQEMEDKRRRERRCPWLMSTNVKASTVP